MSVSKEAVERAKAAVDRRPEFEWSATQKIGLRVILDALPDPEPAKPRRMRANPAVVAIEPNDPHAREHDEMVDCNRCYPKIMSCEPVETPRAWSEIPECGDEVEWTHGCGPSRLIVVTVMDNKLCGFDQHGLVVIDLRLDSVHVTRKAELRRGDTCALRRSPGETVLVSRFMKTPPITVIFPSGVEGTYDRADLILLHRGGCHDRP